MGIEKLLDYIKDIVNNAEYSTDNKGTISEDDFVLLRSILKKVRVIVKARIAQNIIEGKNALKDLSVIVDSKIAELEAQKNSLNPDTEGPVKYVRRRDAASTQIDKALQTLKSCKQAIDDKNSDLREKFMSEDDNELKKMVDKCAETLAWGYHDFSPFYGEGLFSDHRGPVVGEIIGSLHDVQLNHNAIRKVFDLWLKEDVLNELSVVLPTYFIPQNNQLEIDSISQDIEKGKKTLEWYKAILSGELLKFRVAEGLSTFSREKIEEKRRNQEYWADRHKKLVDKDNERNIIGWYRRTFKKKDGERHLSDRISSEKYYEKYSELLHIFDEYAEAIKRFAAEHSLDEAAVDDLLIQQAKTPDYIQGEIEKLEEKIRDEEANKTKLETQSTEAKEKSTEMIANLSDKAKAIPEEEYPAVRNVISLKNVVAGNYRRRNGISKDVALLILTFVSTLQTMDFSDVESAVRAVDPEFNFKGLINKINQLSQSYAD